MRLNCTLCHTHTSHAFINNIFTTAILHAWGKKKRKWRNEEFGPESEFQRDIQNSVFSVPVPLCRREGRHLRNPEKYEKKSYKCMWQFQKGLKICTSCSHNSVVFPLDVHPIKIIKIYKYMNIELKSVCLLRSDSPS